MRSPRNWLIEYLRVEEGLTLSQAKQALDDEFMRCEALEKFFKRIQRDAVRSERKRALAALRK